MQIKGYNLDDDLIAELGKFTVLWNWFENYKCQNSCNAEKIKEISKTISVDAEKHAHLAEVLNKRRHWFGQLATDYVSDSLHPGNARYSSPESQKYMSSFIKQEGKQTDLCRGCLLVILRIRNNMMHGLKSIKELNGQTELFKAVNGVLESIN